MNETEKYTIKTKIKKAKSVNVGGVKYVSLDEVIEILQEVYENSFNIK